jgi:hypothetical protein
MLLVFYSYMIIYLARIRGWVRVMIVMSCGFHHKLWLHYDLVSGRLPRVGLFAYGSK